MTHCRGMSLDRLSVTVPAELGAALRSLAEQRSETVSAIVTQAIESRLRSEALREALDEADRQFGHVSPVLVDEAKSELLRNRAPASPKSPAPAVARAVTKPVASSKPKGPRKPRSRSAE